MVVIPRGEPKRMTAFGAKRTLGVPGLNGRFGEKRTLWVAAREAEVGSENNTCYINNLLQ